MVPLGRRDSAVVVFCPSFGADLKTSPGREVSSGRIIHSAASAQLRGDRDLVPFAGKCAKAKAKMSGISPAFSLLQALDVSKMIIVGSKMYRLHVNLVVYLPGWARTEAEHTRSTHK